MQFAVGEEGESRLVSRGEKSLSLSQCATTEELRGGGEGNRFSYFEETPSFSEYIPVAKNRKSVVADNSRKNLCSRWT